MHIMIIRDCFILTAVQVFTWLVQENKGQGLPVNIQCIKPVIIVIFMISKSTD